MRAIFSTLFFLSSSLALSQQWQDVGGGIDLWVNVMKVDTVNDLLYVGGAFDHAGGAPANSIATWNGTQWQTVGNNEVFSGPGSVNAIAFFNGELIVAGSFDSIGSNEVNNIARFHGGQWQPLGNGFDQDVYDLVIFHGELYACGVFYYSGSDTIPHIARWNGSQWEKVGDGLYGGMIHTMIVFNNKLCVGGQGFYNISHAFPHIGAWDGSSWEIFGSGFNNDVITLNTFQNELYAVGDFTPWTLNQSTRISRWDGNAWQAMPFPTGGTDQRIIDLIGYNNRLYICGYFNNPPDFVRFNGTGYDSICDVSGFINNLAVYKNELYAGGLFNAINGQTIHSIVRYNEGIGVDEFSIFPSDGITIFPNPCSRKEGAKISFSGSLEKDLSVRILDMNGRAIEEFLRISDKTSVIETNKLNPGFYFVQIESKSKSAIKKFIVTP